MGANENTTVGVWIGTELVSVGDLVGENRTPWIKAEVIEIVETISEATMRPMATLTVRWLKDERHHNTIARKGATRRYSVNSYGVSDVRKVR